MRNRYRAKDGRIFAATAALFCLLFLALAYRLIGAEPAPFALSGEAVYIHEVLDAAQSGPTYAGPSAARTGDGPHIVYPNSSLSPNRTTPRYDALVLQRVPGGEPIDVADCRRFPQLGPKLDQVAVDATGRYVAVTSYIPLGRVIHRGPALFVYDRTLKSLVKLTNCVHSFFWSPSGSRCLISDDFGSGLHYDIYDAASGKMTTLPSPAREAPDTAWTNGGRSVVYTDSNATVIEINLKTGRNSVRWRNSSAIVASANSPGYTASPYSESAIGGGWAGDRIAAYGLARARQRRPVRVHLWDLDWTENDLLWSPDGKMLAVRRFTYGLSDPDDNSSLPTSTDQDVTLFDCGSWQESEHALSWSDGVPWPYRYHLVGWAGGHRWLVLLDDGVYHDSGITSERLLAYDTRTEKFVPMLVIGSWISAVDWHTDR